MLITTYSCGCTRYTEDGNNCDTEETSDVVAPDCPGHSH